MYSTVKVGDREIEMAANAASPFIYKNIFHEDFLKKVQEPEPDVEIFQKMGYVMASQAAIDKFSDLMKLNIDTYIEWLAGFEPMDLVLASSAIMNAYMGQSFSDSVPKNEGG